MKPDQLYFQHNPKKVALVGMGPSILDLLPETLTQECSPDFADEVWAINMVANLVRSDLVFWMDDLVKQQDYRPGLFDLLRKYKTPVITSLRRPNVVPNSYDYPIDEVGAIGCQVFGKPYLNNGVAMAVAYALWKGVKHIKIYGCDFSYPNRDFAESGRACVEAWCTLAAVRGMNVALCPRTSLFDQVKDAGIYGYAEQPIVTLPDGTKFRYERAGTATMGQYISEGPTATGAVNAPVLFEAGYRPEDSSHAVQRSVPGTPGPSAGNGRTADFGSVQAGQPQAPAVEGHRQGV